MVPPDHRTVTWVGEWGEEVVHGTRSRIEDSLGSEIEEEREQLFGVLTKIQVTVEKGIKITIKETRKVIIKVVYVWRGKGNWNGNGRLQDRSLTGVQHFPKIIT